MDFYAHRDRAKATSRRLAALFVLSLVVVVFAVNVAAVLGWWALGGGTRWPRWFFATNTFVTLLIVLGGAWAEMHRLRDGAAPLAKRLGAHPLDDGEPLHRRLRDVAEEAAIGAGIPVPSLYVIDDASINALAIGERPSLSAVLVTRGALERLERAELQGVVAHELAHIVGGDSALNTRLTGALYGLLSLRLLGYRMLDAALGRDGPVQRILPLRVVLGVAGTLLAGVGLLGVASAQMLRAGISRQREFLADALAVQITRDRDGLGGALRRIAGEKRPALRSGYVPLVAHFLLVSPAASGDALGTHPPLAERIRRLYGRSMPPIVAADDAHRVGARAREAHGAEISACAPAAAGAAPLVAPGVADAARDDARARERFDTAYLETIPFVRVADAGIDDFQWFGAPASGATARPRMPGAGGTPGAAAQLIERIRAASLGYETAGRWLEALVGGAHDAIASPAPERPDEDLGPALAWVLSPAGAALRVPLLELLLARVRRWSSAHRRELLDRCRRAVERDGRVDSSEWVYYTLARHRLLPGSPNAPRARKAAASRAEQSRALAALFAMASAIGEASARNTRDALADAAAMLDVLPPAATPDEVGTAELTRALDILLGLPPLAKPILLRVLRTLARVPGDANYDAFLRAVAAAIDCPVPREALAPPAIQAANRRSAEVVH